MKSYIHRERRLLGVSAVVQGWLLSIQSTISGTYLSRQLPVAEHLITVAGVIVQPENPSLESFGRTICDVRKNRIIGFFRHKHSLIARHLVSDAKGFTFLYSFDQLIKPIFPFAQSVDLHSSKRES